MAFLPYPTRLVADAIRSQSAERAAVIFYGLTLLVISVLFNLLWGTIAQHRELLNPDVSDDEVRAILVASSPSIGLYGGLMVLAIVAPRFAAFGYLVISIVARLRTRGDEPESESA